MPCSRDVVQTRQAIESAVAFGLLREEERNRMAAAVDIIEGGITETVRFADGHGQLLRIRDEIGTNAS